MRLPWAAPFRRPDFLEQVMLMHARELIELAALLSSHRDELLHKSQPEAPAAMTDYWLAATSRHAEWMRGLAAFESRLARAADPASRVDAWRAWRPLLHEILLHELPARTVAVACRAIDDHHATRQRWPLADRVFQTQLEASRRLLRRMVESYQPSMEPHLRLNQLRRRVEHWTDFLIAPWHRATRVEKYAYDIDRVADFRQAIESGARLGTLTYWDLTLASLKGAFRHQVDQHPFLPRWNYLMASAMFGCLPASVWMSADDISRAWTARLVRSTEQTEQLLAGALRNDFS